MADHLARDGSAPELVFLGSRGEWGGPFWFAHFIWAAIKFFALLIFQKVDLVHIHVSTDGSAFRKCIFGRIARLLRKRYVIHFHGDIKQALDEKPPLWVRALGDLARGAQYSIVLGNAFVAPFRDVLCVQQERIRIVHNGIADIGVNANIPRNARNQVQILFSGEVGKRKGVDLLIGALGKLQHITNDWKCTIAGNGDIAAWRQCVLDAGIADQVEFTGWVDIGTIHALMIDADIVVLPSRAEALPLSLIEGASAGAVLVASAVGAVSDIVVDNVNGKIVDHNEENIARTLSELIADRGMRDVMQVASRQLYLRQFTMEHFVANVLCVHGEAIACAGCVAPVARAAE